MAISNKSNLIGLSGDSGFPKQGKDLSTLGKPSNLTTYTKRNFQREVNNNQLLVSSEASALSQQAFRPTSNIANGGADFGQMFNAPAFNPADTFYLLAECGAFDNMRLITECEEDQIQWITECM